MTGRPRSPGPKRTEMIKILVTPELDALVTAAAKREGRSVSDWGQRLFEREVTASGHEANERAVRAEIAAATSRVARVEARRGRSKR